MENLKPPPNSSPEEIQAWNHMMDTMVTFIKASTNLMNTITSKVKGSNAAMQSAGGAKQYPASDYLESTESMDCEPECVICLPKPPPCGVCGKKVPASQKHTAARETPKSETELSSESGSEDEYSPPVEPPPIKIVPPTPPVSVQPPPQPAEEKPNLPPEEPFVTDLEPDPEPSIPDAVPEEPSVMIEPTPEQSIPAEGEEPSDVEPTAEPSTPVIPEEPSVTEPVPVVPSDPSVVEPTTESPSPAVPEEPSIVKPPTKPVREPSREKTPHPAPSLAAAGDIQCVCAPIRAKRMLMQRQKSSCECYCSKSAKRTRSKKETVDREREEEVQEQIEVEQPPEILCGCGPSAKQREILVQEMVEKLFIAQTEITHLQEEMARLKRMDPTKKTGPHATPNVSQLYQEIMRGSQGQTYQGTGQTTREPGVRNLSYVREELFQSPGWSPYDNVARGAGYQGTQYGRGPGMPSSLARGASYQGGMRQPANKGCPPSCVPVQSGGGGFQSLAGGTVFSPDLSREPPQATGGRGFQSLPGGTVFSPEYSQCPVNTRTPQDSSQAGSRSIPAALSSAGSSSQQGRPTAAQYYQQAQAQYRPSPPQRPGGQCSSARSSYSARESSDGEAYWSRLGEYGSPAPPMQRQDIDCVCSPPKSSGRTSTSGDNMRTP